MQQLNSLAVQQFNNLVFILRVPTSIMPPPTAPPGDRSFALLQWAEGTGGCGLTNVIAAVREIIQAYQVNTKLPVQSETQSIVEKRKQDLQRLLKDDYDLLRRLEERYRVEDDEKRKAKLERDIAEEKELIAAHNRELAEIQQVDNSLTAQQVSPEYLNKSRSIVSLGSDSTVWDFFIAHTGKDTDVAEHLYDLLTPHCRVFLDKRCLKLGDDWDIELTRAQRASRITIVLVSSKTEQAYYQREEIAAAIDMAREEQSQHSTRHRVVPIYLDGQPTQGSTIPYGLRLKHGLDLMAIEVGGIAGAAAQLLELLRQLRSIDDKR
ncbi:MAG: TIR domain-containing protein [Acidobacteriota bacterium]